jgi:hypothetical protein
MSNPLDPGELLRRMALQIAEFAQSTTVTEALKPFDDGFLEDPLFTWCVKYKCHYEPSTLILLNNWDKDRGTNRTTCANVGYCNGYFEHTLPITRDTFNRTFDLFFNTPWSRARINSRFCLVGNMVPGLWRSEQTEGYLGEQVYTQAFHCLWLPVMEEYRIKHIYLCGAWAKGLAKAVRRELRHRVVVRVFCHPAARATKFWNRPPEPDTLQEI